MIRRIAVAAAVTVAAVLGASSALADDTAPPAPTLVENVSWKITWKQCGDLPTGVVIKGKGTKRVWDTSSTDANGVTYFSEVAVITGTATDNRGGRYRFDYHDSVTTSHTTTPYVALLVDHFDLVSVGAFGTGLHTFFMANVTVTSEDPFQATFTPILKNGDPLDFKTMTPHCDPL
jgi:hypothetical protein